MSISYPGFSPTRPYGARENPGTRLYIYMAGKVKRILCPDWLPERARSAHPARDFLRWSCKKNLSFWLFHKFFIDQVCFVKMAGCWHVLFCVFFFFEWFYWENVGVFNRWSLMKFNSTLFDVVWCTHHLCPTTVSYGTVYSPHPLPFRGKGMAARLP